MENMKNKYSKCLTSARKVPGSRPQMVFFKDAYREAEWVAGKIKELRDEGSDLSHQAVLFRSAYISIPLQAELSKRSIPYQVFGGLKFYETGHVRDMLAHLKVIANLKDELGWMRLLMLIEGIGPKTSERICNEIVKCNSFDDVLSNVFQKYNHGYKFCANMARLKGALKSIYDKKLDPGEQFARVLDYYSPILQEKFDNWHVRLNDLETLKQISTRYNSLEELLADFAIEPPEKAIMNMTPGLFAEEKPLTLSTIHSAKGLEWGHVFLIGLMEGVLPVSFALDNEDESEEEHRLFYVAITRAKNELFLSMHHEGVKGGISRFNQISSFVDMPNVLSKLDQNAEVGGRLEEAEYDGEEMSVVYDKDVLFRRVIDSFE
jgi:DNA helicase-2/ATP-dependent DNA helicase PcrA